jgi:hypothetical protein
MKKLFAIVALVIISISSFAQISSIKVTDEVTVDKLYAGSLSKLQFSTDSLSTTGYTSLRVGAMATYKPVKWISFTSWAICQTETGTSPWTLQQAYLTITPIKKLSVTIGSMATLVTEQRPLPVTADGQFESVSESQIPGGSLGAKVKYNIGSSFQLAGGIAVRKGLPEYAGRITYKKVQLSGWYSQCDSLFGTALTVDFKRVYSTFVFKQKTIADVLTIKLSKDWSLYSDVVYDLSTKKLYSGEIGIMKSFESKYLKGLFGLTYDYKLHSVSSYLFIHL